MPPQTKDTNRKQSMNTIHQLKIPNQPETHFPYEILLKSDHSYTSKASKHAIDDEIKGLLHRNTFSFVNKKKISPEENVLWGIILAIKQPGTANEQYSGRFIVQRHKDKDKDLIMHTPRTVRHRNIRLMSSIVAMFPSHKMWLQDNPSFYRRRRPSTRFLSKICQVVQP